MKITRSFIVGAVLAALLFVSSVAFAVAPSKTKHIPVILETDMGNDIDDALAVALMFKAQDEGLLKVLAIGNHKKSDTATDFIDILSTFYGYPLTPIAKSSTPVVNNNARDYTAAVCRMKDSSGAPLYKRSKKPSDILEPVSLFRKVLAKAPDHSVVVISLGFGTDLAALLESGPDKYSKLGGKELIARKVKFLSIMAGSYGPKIIPEFNVVNDILAMKKVFEQWPAPIVQNPFELGPRLRYPASVIESGFTWTDHHPVVDAYKDYRKMPYDRQTWDLLSVVYLLHPELFEESLKGNIMVDGAGFTHFSEKADGNAVWLTASDAQCKQLLDFIVAETTKRPKK